MRGQSLCRIGWAAMVLGLVAWTLVPACQAAGGGKQASPDQQKRIEAMRASGSPMRVGVFDSRAVALAYYRSEPFGREMKKLKADFEKAKAAGDKKRVAELEAKGPAQQELMHKQGFGTWGVLDILKKIDKKLPEIAKQANVTIIVSKWDLAYQRSNAQFVNVTELIVKPFDPDEKTQKMIEEIQKQEPVPLEQLQHHQD